MGPTVSDVIALAQNTKALSKEQLARILELAPKMTEVDLEKLRQMITSIQASDLKKMERELAVRQKMNVHYMDWKSDKARNSLQTQEGAVQREDTAQAESLIQNI